VIPWHIIQKKLLWDARKRYAKVEFWFQRKQLIALLEKSIPNLTIETTNICNADCIFCAYQFQKRPTGIMSMELFQKLIDEYVELGGGSLGLTPTVGDPLVDKWIVERVRYARSKPKIRRIGMYSNMISLDRIGLNELLHSGIDSLIVSTSGFEEKMYVRVYRSQMYRQMLRNVKQFAEANNAAGRPVDFQIDMRVDRPAEEVAALVDRDKIGLKFRYDNWAGFIKPDQLSGNMTLRVPLQSKPAPCSELYSGPIVYWDGKAGACGCRDVNASELIIGDATRSHLGAIWFGEEIRKLRDEFMTDQIRPICQSCTHYNSVAVILMNKKRLVQIQPSPFLADRKEVSIGA
jgi:hypothetical protein